MDNLENSLNAVTSEYLDAFIIFGYDLNGNLRIVKNVQNQMENLAINAVVEEYLFDNGRIL